ncbi:response regulator transcription factor [Nocardioides albidus]|uniref:response regulator transcription factor n=1 Tax=Nocardioides albidus TaxID=1517589 RepID=UPI00130508E2|nr:LuxR C-terminal-related transcriptional regulator [Nocardioides albidus]
MLGSRRPGTPSRAMRITIIDHHLTFADSLATILEQEGYLVTPLRLGPSHASLTTVLAAALRNAGRLVLLEPDLGRLGDGTRLISPMTTAGATVVLLTQSVDRSRWGEAVRKGAKGVLHKTCSVRQVVSIARRVGEGLPLMTPEQRASLIAAAETEREQVRAIRSRLGRLTARESEILDALMHGEQVREIARTRVVEEATVRSQVKSILSKLEVGSQIAAVGAAYHVGWEPTRARGGEGR